VLVVPKRHIDAFVPRRSPVVVVVAVVKEAQRSAARCATHTLPGGAA
jgi:hypothetical protein